MPVDAFSAYRPVSVFLMTLAVADGLYRCQAIKICNRNYLNLHGSTIFLLASSRIIGIIGCSLRRAAHVAYWWEQLVLFGLILRIRDCFSLLGLEILLDYVLRA